MARALNRVTLLGNLGADPDVRTTPQGRKVANIRLATTESYKDNNGEWKEYTDWHRIVFWDYLADNIEKYVKKGHKLYVEGKLKSRSYEDKEGITRYVTEVLAKKMIMLTPRSESNQQAGNNSSYTDGNSVEFQSNDTEKDDDLPF